MGLKDLAARNARAMGAADRPESARNSERLARPITAPGAAAIMRPTFDALEQRAAQAEAEVQRLTLEANKQIKLPLDQLVSIPGRRRKLSEDEFVALRENIRNNPLVTPIVVKALGNKRYEIISGDNRVAVYRSLGRESIEATISDLSADEGVLARAAFHANLLQPELPDFEKYLGFRAEIDRSALSRAEVAAAAGVSPALLSHLMVFEKLPDAAIELLRTSPSVLGFQAARKLVNIAEAGGVAEVVAAIDDLVAGRKGQDEAVREAASKLRPAKAGDATSRTVKYKQGRSAYCNVRIVGPELRMTFCDDDTRAQLESELLEVLGRYAKASS